jgi:curved DNA-binding protein CbpA
VPSAESAQDYYQILGVARDATRDDIEKAYFDLARRLHPDVAGGGDEATARFMLINEAYQTLGSPVSRREYDLTLKDMPSARGALKEQAQAAPAVRTAEEPRAGAAQRLDDRVKRLIRQADRLCEQGNFWQASDMLHRLIPHYPRQPALRRALARASLGKLRFREAADHLKVACEVEYFNSDNHVLLGEAYMKGGMWAKAREALADALSWNEENERAKRDMVEVARHMEKELPPLKRLLGKLSRLSRPGGGRGGGHGPKG